MIPTYNAVQRNALARGVTKSPEMFQFMVANEPQRLNIIAEGDSWFGYPPKYLLFGSHSNILDWVGDKMRGDINLLRLESNGDEAMEMLTGTQKHKLIDVLSASGEMVDAILFSGGGNDLVGDSDMPLLLRPEEYQEGMDVADILDWDKVCRRLQMIALALRDLMAIRNELAPHATIFTHVYDTAYPSEEGLHLFGGLIGDVFKTTSWIKPYMDDLNIPPGLQCKVVAELMEQLESVYMDLEDSKEARGRFKVLPTRGTLKPNDKDHWLNEIHPTSEGFELIADHFVDALRSMERTRPEPRNDQVT